MVTIIDNLNLDENERKAYEALLAVPPFSAQVSRWINIEDVAEQVRSSISDDEFHVVVSSGGVEVYSGDNAFVFDSKSVKGDSERIHFDDYVKLTQYPEKNHKKEIERLRKNLPENVPVKIIEGDVSNSGLSMARICAIYDAIYRTNLTEVLIGVAPAEGMFNVKRIRENRKGQYDKDLRSIIPSAKDMKHTVFVQCKDSYIRRASEVLGVNEREKLDKDISIMYNHYLSRVGEGMARKYADAYRHINLKKLNRLDYISQRKAELGL